MSHPVTLAFGTRPRRTRPAVVKGGRGRRQDLPLRQRPTPYRAAAGADQRATSPDKLYRLSSTCEFRKAGEYFTC